MNLLSNKQREYVQNANRRWNIKTGATRLGKTYPDVLYTIPQRIVERKGEKGLVILQKGIIVVSFSGDEEKFQFPGAFLQGFLRKA